MLHSSICLARTDMNQDQSSPGSRSLSFGKPRCPHGRWLGNGSKVQRFLPNGSGASHTCPCPDSKGRIGNASRVTTEGDKLCKIHPATGVWKVQVHRDSVTVRSRIAQSGLNTAMFKDETYIRSSKACLSDSSIRYHRTALHDLIMGRCSGHCVKQATNRAREDPLGHSPEIVHKVTSHLTLMDV
jgi:hypothetical protein